MVHWLEEKMDDLSADCSKPSMPNAPGASLLLKLVACVLLIYLTGSRKKGEGGQQVTSHQANLLQSAES